MTKKPNAQDFLRALQGASPEADAAPPALPQAAVAPGASPPAATVHPLPRTPKARAKPAKPSRAQLKHFGGYLEDDTLEKIALLRHRLKLDNSELIKVAIDDLFRKHNAKRAFGDA